MNGDQVQRETALKDLLTAGQQALDSGDQEAAHELWRAAAVANPYDERVWQSLLSVLSSDEDRRVCLENIVAINPNNVEARRQLRGLKRENRQSEEAEQSTEALSPDDRRQARALRRERRLREEAVAQITPLPSSEPAIEFAPLPQEGTGRSRVVVRVISAALLAIILGVVISVIVYGGILSRIKP